MREYRFANRIESENEAIRQLIEAGLSLRVAKPVSRPEASIEQTEKTAPRKRAPRAKPLAMSKEAQIRVLREQACRGSGESR